jgi:hypothetical protein
MASGGITSGWCFDEFGDLERETLPSAHPCRLCCGCALASGFLQRTGMTQNTSVLPFSSSATIRQ